MYVRLAKAEERDARRQFGEDYARYAGKVPAFLPKLLGPSRVASP
jgi:protein-S-isoprenylcysteine O-methyltransferase Ste14